MTEKFKAMVHLIVASCPDPNRLGATRLNKICWFADSVSYRALGSGITTETYVKRPRGPVPKSILNTIRQLVDEGKIVVKDSGEPVYRTRLFVSLNEPNKSLFSSIELDIIAHFSKTICEEHTANSISELSHDEIWTAAIEGEEIPLYATLVADSGEITPEISAWADSVLQGMLANRAGEQNVVAAH